MIADRPRLSGSRKKDIINIIANGVEISASAPTTSNQVTSAIVANEGLDASSRVNEVGLIDCWGNSRS